MIQRLEYQKSMHITPDNLLVPAWNIRVFFRSPGSYPVTAKDGHTIIGGQCSVHCVLLGKNRNDYSVLDYRIWTKEKAIAVWVCSVNSLRILKSSLEDIHNSNAKLNCNCSSEIFKDIYDYDIYFVEWGLCNNIAIRCNYNDLELLIEEGTIPYDNIKYRVFNHLMTPMQKRRELLHSPELQNERLSYYRESCKMWYNKIKNLDIAEYHLLIWED